MRKTFLTFFLFLVLISCNKKNKQETTPKTDEVSKTKTVPQVYYFSQKALGKGVLTNISSINKCPKCDFLPWTESIRISGIGFLGDDICFVINKVGILPFSSLFSGYFDIFPNPLFPFFTATGFYSTDVGFLVKSYKNTMFESIGNFEEDKLTHEELPILNRYNPITKDLEPILFPHHFSLPAYAALTELNYNDSWFASFKLDDGKNVQFKYFKFDSINDILNASYTPITSEMFMDAMLPILEDSVRFSYLPAQFIRLVKNMEEESVNIEYFNANLLNASNKHSCPIKIIRNTGKANNLEVSKYEAVAFSNATKEGVMHALLLNTGKLYIYDAKGDTLSTYLLPKLPKDFCYTYFALHEGVILAGWEEQDFFECGRTGFITAPIEKLKQL